MPGDAKVELGGQWQQGTLWSHFREKVRGFRQIDSSSRYVPTSVILVVEISEATLPFISNLQNSLNLLLVDQLSHTQHFNLTRHVIFR